MKQIFLKVLKDGTTVSNVSSLVFDGENLTTKVSIDYSQVEFSDWIKQADIFVGQTRETDYVYTNEVGNTLEFLLEEGHLVKGYLRIQPLVKRLEEGSIYSKQKWETIELKVKKSLNVLEDDISITQSIAEQWEIRIQAVESAELIRVENEDIRLANEIIREDNEDLRIANENARNVFVAFNALTAYVVGNKVNYNGSSYRCILNSTGNLPTNTTYWMVIAQAGEVTNVAMNTALANKADKLFATNLATNGDFSNGITGWLGIFSNISVLSNILSVVGTNSNSSARVSQSSTSTITNSLGRKIYTRARVRVTNSLCTSISSRLVDSVGGDLASLVVSVSNPIINIWYNISTLFNISNIQNGSTARAYFQHNYSNTTDSTNAVMEVQYVQELDLTQIFGAGKEPTKEQVDWLLAQKYTNSWFDGTKELTSITDLLTLVNTKANITQEAWITPTLLNSWTGVAGQMPFYMIDQFGFVHVKGTVTGGTAFSAIMTFPNGYKTLSTRSFATSANNAFARVSASVGGSITHSLGSNVNVYLDCILYKAEA